LGPWDFWSVDDDVRDGAFTTLRREAPVSHHPEFVEGGPGHWAVTRYEDVFFASRHPEIFSSAAGITVGDQTPELNEYFGSMIAMDDPRHARLRTIVRSAFTPRVLARIEDSVRQRADHQRIFHWTNVILGFGDPEVVTDFDDFVTVAMEIGAYATALADDRRARPGDDFTTSLVQADLDGERLTSAEVASFFILLVVAGNETTRNAISHGVLALSRYPEQRRDWWADYRRLAPTAVEEIVRWASPVAYMRRTVTRDTELSGGGAHRRRQGHAVVRLGEPRRDEVRRAVAVRCGPPAQSPRRFRRRRSPLLLGRQPGAARDHRRVRRIAPPGARHRRDGLTRPAAFGVHPRHQTIAGGVDAAALAAFVQMSGGHSLARRS
jgi:methyl-branched lipid omega-hydroxylase